MFASLVKNDDLVHKKQNRDVIQQLQMRSEMPRGLTHIQQEDDIYKIGTLCQAKVIHDKQNPFMPYALNLFCVEKAKITTFVDKIAPLSRVEVLPLTNQLIVGPEGHALMEEDLPHRESVIFQFLK